MNSATQITWKKSPHMNESIGWLFWGRILTYFGGHFENIDFPALCVKIQLGIRQKSILRTKLPLEPVSKVFHTLHATISTPVPAYSIIPPNCVYLYIFKSPQTPKTAY